MSMNFTVHMTNGKESNTKRSLKMDEVLSHSQLRNIIIIYYFLSDYYDQFAKVEFSKKIDNGHVITPVKLCLQMRTYIIYQH